MERLAQMRVVKELRGTSEYEPGDLGIPYPDRQPGEWYVRCPECGGRASLRLHSVTEHEDGTVTLSPSLLCPGVEVGRCTAHYFVEHNKIRWC